MKQFLAGVLVLQIWVSIANAQDTDLTMISGTCQIIQVKSKSAQCGTPSNVIYSQTNGIVLIQVVLADDGAFAFVGDRDSEPKPEEYILYLKRVRFTRGSESEAVDVTGTCTMRVSTDGSLVDRVICDATNSQGDKYLLDFRGDGQPVVVKHF